MMITFGCPYCHGTVNVPPTERGNVVECPHCKEGVRVPMGGGGGAAAGVSAGLIVGIVSLVLVVFACPMIIIVCLAAISVLGQKASGTFTSVGSTIQQNARSADGRCEMNLPPGWSPTAMDLGGNHQMQVANMGKTLFMVVNSDPKADFAADMSYREYGRSMASGYLTVLEDARISAGPKEVIINGRPAVQHEITGTLKENRLKVTYLHVVLDGKDRFYRIAGWCAQSRFAENRSELERAAHSFREVGN